MKITTMRITDYLVGSLWMPNVEAWKSLNYGRDYIAWAGGNQTKGDFKRTILLQTFIAMSDADLTAIAAEAVHSMP